MSLEDTVLMENKDNKKIIAARGHLYIYCEVCGASVNHRDGHWIKSCAISGAYDWLCSKCLIQRGVECLAMEELRSEAGKRRDAEYIKEHCA